MGNRKNLRNKKKHKKQRRRIMFLLLEILTLILLVGIAFVKIKYDRFQITNFEDGDIQTNEGIRKEGYTTIALFGGDSREGELAEGTHADTMIVASLNNKTGEIKMSSVYRDTLMEQMDGQMKKANNAYFVGGPKEAINMLNRNLDLAIDNYVTVDFAALANVVELVNGVHIEVTEEEVNAMNLYIGETAKAAGRKADYIQESGFQRLSGVQAVTYARIRKLDGGDYKRTERQRKVIQNIFEKLRGADIKTLNKIVDSVFSQVSTSFSLSELVKLVPGIAKYYLGETTGFPMDVTDGTYDGVGSIVIPVGMVENVEQLHAFLYPDQEYEVSDTVGEVATKIERFTGITRDDYVDPNAAKTN